MIRITLAVFVLSLILALPTQAVMFRPSSTPAEPVPSPAALEAARTTQQSSAPRIAGGMPPTSTHARQGSSAAPTAEGPGVLVSALEASQRQQAAGPTSAGGAAGGAQDSGRARGIALMAAGAAGLVGLALGRLGLNAISKTTGKEAEKAIQASAARGVDSRSFGGEHREYVIDTDSEV